MPSFSVEFSAMNKAIENGRYIISFPHNSWKAKCFGIASHPVVAKETIFCYKQKH